MIKKPKPGINLQHFLSDKFYLLNIFKNPCVLLNRFLQNNSRQVHDSINIAREERINVDSRF